MEITLGQLAVRLDGKLRGGDVDCPVRGVAGYDAVTEGTVTYIQSDRDLAAVEASAALAIIVPSHITRSCKPLISVQDPRMAFITALRLCDWRRPPLPGIDPTAHIARSAAIHGRAHLGPHVVVGEYAVVGDGCILYANSCVGDHSEIGAGSILHPNVTIYPRCAIGRGVIIHAGAVIGADGLGFEATPHGWEKVPHLGTVVIEDDVEIGALTAIDRATTGTTLIGKGSKIDNLVQIAHNVTIGPGCMIVAQAGVAGSATVGAGVVIAGQAGVSDHKQVGSHTRIGARAGVVTNIAADMTVSGFPAQNHLDALRQEAAIRRLPELLARVKELERQLAADESPADNDGNPDVPPVK